MDSIFLACLAASLAIEVPILVVFLRIRQRSPPLSRRRVAVAGLLATATSLPYLWFLAPMVVPDDFFWWIGEGTVVVIEASILAFVLPLPVRDSLLASMLCNLSSLAFGSLALRVLEHSRGSAWAW